MFWHSCIPDIIVGSIEKGSFLTRSRILIDIFLIRYILLRGEYPSIPLPTEGIRCDISIEEMTIEPLRWNPPVRMRHIGDRSCDIHSEMIMHISRFFENLDRSIKSVNSSIFFEKSSRHIIREDIFLIKSDIRHELLSSE